APARAAAIDEAAARWARVCSGEDSTARHQALFELMSISEDDETVNGDLVRARTDASAIARELAELGSILSARERDLLRARLLELDPNGEVGRAMPASPRGSHS